MATQIQLRRGTSAEWAAANPVLAQGEVGIDLTLGKMRLGDGVTAWAGLTPIGAAADAGDFATAEQGAKADASDVDQITLTGDLVLTLPVGRPAGQVYRVVFTQDGTGGHTVTYGGQPVTVDTTAGASTLVEVWPGGTLVYPGSSAPAGASSAITADDTPAAPAEGESASYFVTSAVVWPAGLVWSTDPDGGVAPGITVSALVSLFTVGGVTYAVSGATFPEPPDTIAPSIPANLTATAASELSIALAWDPSTDNVAVTGYEYSIDGGAAVDAGAGIAKIVNSLAPSTLYSFTVRAYDDAGNRSDWSSAASATTDEATSSITDTFTRADSNTTLGTTETGAKAWSAAGGVYGVSTNKAYLVSGLAADRPSATIDAGSTNQDVSARIYGINSASGNGHYALLVARWTSAATCYQLVANFAADTPGVVTLSRRVDGTNSILYTSPGSTFASGDLFRLTVAEEAGGTRVIAYLNGVQLYSYLDTNAGRPATSTRCGIAAVPNASISGSARWDDFTAIGG